MFQNTPRFQAGREGLLRFSSVTDNQVLLYKKIPLLKLRILKTPSKLSASSTQLSFIMKAASNEIGICLSIGRVLKFCQSAVRRP